jgi:hypothetical protein
VPSPVSPDPVFNLLLGGALGLLIGVAAGFVRTARGHDDRVAAPSAGSGGRARPRRSKTTVRLRIGRWPSTDARDRRAGRLSGGCGPPFSSSEPKPGTT